MARIKNTLPSKSLLPASSNKRNEASLTVGKKKSAGPDFVCDECQFVCTDQLTLDDHMNTHSKPLVFKCPRCLIESFGHYGNLRFHLSHCNPANTPKQFELIRSNARSFNGFANQTVSNPFVKYSGSETPGYICSNCGKSYQHNRSLTRHLKKHQRVPTQLEDAFEKMPSTFERVLQCASTGPPINLPIVKIEQSEASSIVALPYSSNKPDHRRILCELCGKSYLNKDSFFTHRSKNHREITSINRSSPFKNKPFELKYVAPKPSSISMVTRSSRKRSTFVSETIETMDVLAISNDVPEWVEPTKKSSRTMSVFRNSQRLSSTNNNNNNKISKSKVKPFTCTLCSTQYLTNRSLQRHLKSKHHGSRELLTPSYRITEHEDKGTQTDFDIHFRDMSTQTDFPPNHHIWTSNNIVGDRPFSRSYGKIVKPSFFFKS